VNESFHRVILARTQLIEATFGLKIVADRPYADDVLINNLQAYLTPADFEAVDLTAWASAGGEITPGVDPELPQLVAVQTADGWSITGANLVDDLVRYLENHGINQDKQLKFLSELILRDEDFLTKLLQAVEPAQLIPTVQPPVTPAPAPSPEPPKEVLVKELPVPSETLLILDELFKTPLEGEDFSLGLVELPGGATVHFDVRMQSESGWWLVACLHSSQGPIGYTLEPTRDLKQSFNFNVAGQEVQVRLHDAG
jgi:hypothetical protein